MTLRISEDNAIQVASIVTLESANNAYRRALSEEALRVHRAVALSKDKAEMAVSK